MQAGHGTFLSEEITLLGDPIDSFVARDFNINRDPISNVRGAGVFSFGNDAGVPKPYITEEKCLRCGVCIDMCPISPKALEWQGGDKAKPPVYDYGRCIRCFCCQELCPHGAVLIKEPAS
jgi:NAD-dependent dihydropyrimidine dehydrogenase PreA subunit